MKQEDIIHLARLARIALSEEEAARLTSDITGILTYVSEVQEIAGGGDTDKQVGARANVFRDDTHPTAPNVHTETLLAAAPERDGRYIKVKKIIADT